MLASIFGPASKSTNAVNYANIKTALTESISDTFMSTAQSSVNSLHPKQSITLSNFNADGSISISGITQTSVANIDSKSFMSIVSESELRNKLTSALKSAQKADQSVEQGLFAGSTENSVNTTIADTNISRVVNSVNYSTFQDLANEIFNEQSIDISGLKSGKNISVADVDQYVKLDILSSNIADIMTKEIQVINQESAIDSSSEVAQASKSGITSETMGKIVQILIVIAIVVALIIAVYVLVAYGGAIKTALGFVTKGIGGAGLGRSR